MDSFIEAVQKFVDKDSIDKKVISTSENIDTVKKDAVREITSNVLDFADWAFEKPVEGYLDPRADRLSITGNKDESKNSLTPLVKDIVESNLAELRDMDELPVEPDVDNLTNQLVNYIVNWQKWYYDYHVEQKRLAFGDLAGINDDIYIGSDYGDLNMSQGISNIYDEENAPFPESEET